MDKRWEATPMYYLAGRYTSLLNFAVSITYVFALASTELDLFRVFELTSVYNYGLLGLFRSQRSRYIHLFGYLFIYGFRFISKIELQCKRKTSWRLSRHSWAPQFHKH